MQVFVNDVIFILFIKVMLHNAVSLVYTPPFPRLFLISLTL